MTDDQRPELEWPSEDFAASGKKPEPKPEVAWPSEDVAKATKATPPAPEGTTEPTPKAPEPAKATPAKAKPGPPPAEPAKAEPAVPTPQAAPTPAPTPTPQAAPTSAPEPTPAADAPTTPAGGNEPQAPSPAFDAPAQVPPPSVTSEPPAAAPPAPTAQPAVTPPESPSTTGAVPAFTAPESPSAVPPPAPEPAAYPAQQPPAVTPPEIPTQQEAPLYQQPADSGQQPPGDPWAIPPAAAQQQAYAPPPEYGQPPADDPLAPPSAPQQPLADDPLAPSGWSGQPAYGEQQPFGQEQPYGQQQPYGVPPQGEVQADGQPGYGNPNAAQGPYQNQFADPSEPATPGPYAGAGTPPPTETEDTAEEGKSYFRKDIEGLRAVAVLAVLLFHVGVPYFDGGFVGVDVFYVISGFLITGLLLREGQDTGKVDLLRFYARRMRRLLPAALLVIVVTLALSAFIVSPLRLTEIAGDAAASALYVANFRFALEATDYLATAAPSPLLHFWSLGVEEQFYLFWPLILLAAVRFLPGRLTGLFVLLLALASFALSLVWTSTMPEWAFFSPLTRAWELAAGALIAIGLLRIPQRVPRIAGSVAVVVGLLLIAASVLMGGILAELDLSNDELVNALFASPDSPFPGVAAVPAVLGAVLVIVGGSHSRTLIGRVLLGNPVSRYIGRISYSLYLWHWPILILIPIQLGVDDLATRLALAGVSIVLAVLSTELWERPWRRSGALEKRSGSTVRLGLVGSVGVGVTAIFMTGSVTLPSDIELPWIQPPKVVAELAGVREDLPAHYDDRCHLLGYGRKKLMTECVYGDSEGAQTAMLVGDSHAAQWLPALDVYAREQGKRLEVYTKAACPVIDVPVWERDLRKVFDDCIAWRDKVRKHIRETKPDVVYVGLSRDYELWDGTVKQSSDATGYWREQLTSYLTTIGRPAEEVVLLAETPFLRYDPVDCLADADIASCDPPTSRVVDTQYAALERQAAEDAGAELLSINPLLCDETSCPVVVDDIVVFRDNHHLTASYMEYLAEPIGNLLEGRPAYPTPAPTRPPVAPAVGAETAAQDDGA